MKVFLFSKHKDFAATGDFDLESKTLVVLKGSRVSSNISTAKAFRAASAIKKKREAFTENGILLEDITFNSPSTAANFVTGSSTNGWEAWKTEDGRFIKILIGKR